MDNFVVSARKYRPISFETVVGQAHITTALQYAIKNNQLAQALLFCGPRGVGKTTCARILAKTINESAFPKENKTFEQLANFNIYELDAASNNSVDDIRGLVEQVRYPPQQGKFKVYIIDEVHMLSNQAFNAFLKTLEEPPKYVIFILATTEKHKILPTILSRCQIFDFKRITIADIADQLVHIAQAEGIVYDATALHLIAQKADGAMRDALSLFDMLVTCSKDKHIDYQTTITNLHILDYDYYFSITDALLDERIAETLLLFDEIQQKGFDAHNFINGLCDHFRNLMVCKSTNTVKLLEGAAHIAQKYMLQAERVHIPFILSALQIGNLCDINFKASKNKRLHIEIALMKMCYLNNAIKLATLKDTDIQISTNLPAIEQESKGNIHLPATPKVATSVGEVAKILARETLDERPSDKAENIEKTPGQFAEKIIETGRKKSAVTRPDKAQKTVKTVTPLDEATEHFDLMIKKYPALSHFKEVLDLTPLSHASFPSN